MRVGIVGSGISGLTAAWLLSREGHDVTIFESHPVIGMGAHGTNYTSDTGEVVRLDVPFRVISEKHYIHFCCLLDEVGVERELCNLATSYHWHGEDRILARHRNFVIGGRTFINPFVMGWNIFSWSFLSIVGDWLRWERHSRVDLAAGKLEGLSLKQYIDSKGFSHDFLKKVFLPVLCTMMTCDEESALEYPAEMIAKAFATARGHGVKRAKGGTDTVVERLVQQVKKIHLNTWVHGVERTKNGTTVTYAPKSETKGGPKLSEIFDHVILATEVHEVLPLLRNPNATLLEAFKAWKWESSEVVIHTDASLMPRYRRDWSPMNMLSAQDAKRPATTLWLNQILPQLQTVPDVFQTWNPLVQPKESTVLDRATFTRPLMDIKASDTIRQLMTLQGKDNIWFCGSYAVYGPPLLENGVLSAMDVAEALGVTVPWRAKASRRKAEYEAARHASNGCGWTLLVVLLITVALIYRYLWRS